MKTVRTLLLHDNVTFADLPADIAACFGDNGGEPDGNVWLPLIPLDERDEGVQEILDAGMGSPVWAVYTTAWEYARGETLGDLEAEAWLANASGEEVYRYVCGVLENTTDGWAGFGTGDVIAYIPHTSEF